jgi:hypothetical protein
MPGETRKKGKGERGKGKGWEIQAVPVLNGFLAPSKEGAGWSPAPFEDLFRTEMQMLY